MMTTEVMVRVERTKRSDGIAAARNIAVGTMVIGGIGRNADIGIVGSLLQSLRRKILYWPKQRERRMWMMYPRQCTRSIRVAMRKGGKLCQNHLQVGVQVIEQHKD